jgi:hypothetical protein
VSTTQTWPGANFIRWPDGSVYVVPPSAEGRDQRTLDILVAQGWAERRPDEADHRACVIGITGAGAALIDTIRQDNATWLASCITRLDAADLAVLRAALPVLESLAQQAACRTAGVTVEAALA